MGAFFVHARSAKQINNFPGFLFYMKNYYFYEKPKPYEKTSYALLIPIYLF